MVYYYNQQIVEAKSANMEPYDIMVYKTTYKDCLQIEVNYFVSLMCEKTKTNVKIEDYRYL